MPLFQLKWIFLHLQYSVYIITQNWHKFVGLWRGPVCVSLNLQCISKIYWIINYIITITEKKNTVMAHQIKRDSNRFKECCLTKWFREIKRTWFVFKGAFSLHHIAQLSVQKRWETMVLFLIKGCKRGIKRLLLLCVCVCPFYLCENHLSLRQKKSFIL